MLKQRILTALVLVVVVMLALFAKNPIYWQALVSIAILVAFYEWLRFCKINDLMMKVGGYVLFAVVFIAIQKAYIPLNIVVILACCLWAVLLFFTITNSFKFLHNQWLKLLIGVLVLSSSGHLVVEFKTLPNGPLWILCFMVSIWAADVGAYFFGKRFGKTKLAPNISPGKTVEGFAGGVFTVLLIYVPILFTNLLATDALLLLITVMITAMVSVGGDLFESKLKRHAGLKDSSNILPGHGGVLDRIDSLLAGAPVFAAGLMLLGKL